MASKRINNPCPHCGRAEVGSDGDAKNSWYDPCPADDCPSNNPNKDKMGYCPKCGEREWSVAETDIEAWSDDTPFPTISVQFECDNCSHQIEVSYDREYELHTKSNRERIDWSYDPDINGGLDGDD
jgi:hypothetical protein